MALIKIFMLLMSFTNLIRIFGAGSQLGDIGRCQEIGNSFLNPHSKLLDLCFGTSLEYVYQLDLIKTTFK